MPDKIDAINRCCPSSNLPLQKLSCEQGFQSPALIAFAYNLAVSILKGRLLHLSLNILSAKAGCMIAILVPFLFSVLILYLVFIVFIFGCYYYYTHPTSAEGTGKVESIYGWDQAHL
jgi:hypothetical protein